MIGISSIKCKQLTPNTALKLYTVSIKTQVREIQKFIFCSAEKVFRFPLHIHDSKSFNLQTQQQRKITKSSKKLLLF